MSVFFLYCILVISLLFPSIKNGHANSINHYSTLEKRQKITVFKDFSYEIQINQKTLIIDPKGLSHGNFNIIVDNFTTILDFQCNLINPKTGKTIKKYKTKDLNKRSLIEEGTLFHDAIVQSISPESPVFPVEVEINLSLKKSGNFNFPSWIPFNNNFQQVSHAILEVVYPKHLGLRYKSEQFEGEFSKSSSPDMETLKWEVKDLAPVNFDSKETILSEVKLAPKKFGMEGFEANMDTWKDFGHWFLALNKGQDELPEEIKKMVQELVQDEDSPHKKINILYQYLQNNIRYVSIQLGIGGWRPMSSKEVITNKYGDCKGLTILMKALLKEAGIHSDYTLVMAGANPSFDLEFPSNQFNHAILRVPMKADTLWLECTSDIFPAGYLGSFTSNRPVLVITQEGGELDHTPSYARSSFNSIQISAAIQLKENGDASIEGSLIAKGLPAEEQVYQLRNGNEKENLTYFNKKIGANGLVMHSFTQSRQDEFGLLVSDLSFQGMILRYFQNTNKRIFIPLNWFNWSIDPKTPNIHFKEELLVKKHRSLLMEAGTKISNVENEYYRLNLKITSEEETIVIEKSLELNIPNNLLPEKRDNIIQEIHTHFNQQLVFLKQH